MKYTFFQAAGWFVLYVILILSPMVVALASPITPGRGFWVETGVALGFIGIAMLSLQFLITGRYRNFAMGFGSDNILHFHTMTGIVAMSLVLLHPALIILADSYYLSFFDPRVNFLRALALIPVTFAVVAIIVLSLWRKRFKLVYEWWRLSHGLLAFFVVFVGLVHILQVGRHSHLWWQKAYLVGFAGGAMALLIHVRLIKPMILKRHPYKIVNVIKEYGDAITLEIEAINHRGMHFDAGQYAWITVGDTPFSLQQHPFSFSSGEGEPQRVSLTAKPLGDFTKKWKDFQPGTKVFLEGPYGAFTLVNTSALGALFFAGGVGITPIMSMLRTLARNDDKRPLMLFYANKRWDDIIFRDEIEGLKETLNLQVIHVLEEPPEDWSGEVGYMTKEMLDKYLPKDLKPYYCYICGPEPMTDMVESELITHDIALPQIMSERFNIV